jgi:hypothetical protein
MVNQSDQLGAKNRELAAEHQLPHSELTSKSFERHGCWFYYGVIGRHLYTMELPESEIPSR